MLCPRLLEIPVHALGVESAGLRGVPSVHNSQHLLGRALKGEAAAVLGHQVGERVRRRTAVSGGHHNALVLAVPCLASQV